MSDEKGFAEDINKPEVLAFIAAMLGWQEGQPIPQPPVQMAMTVPELMERLNDPETRALVVRRLSPLIAYQPNRADRRRKKRK